MNPRLKWWWIRSDRRYEGIVRKKAIFGLCKNFFSECTSPFKQLLKRYKCIIRKGFNIWRVGWYLRRLTLQQTIILLSFYSGISRVLYKIFEIVLYGVMPSLYTVYIYLLLWYCFNGLRLLGQSDCRWRWPLILVFCAIICTSRYRRTGGEKLTFGLCYKWLMTYPSFYSISLTSISR